VTFFFSPVPAFPKNIWVTLSAIIKDFWYSSAQTLPENPEGGFVVRNYLSLAINNYL
jgi:hypothetical protein